MDVVADDLGFPEGPVLLDDGTWLVTEIEASRGCVTALNPDGSRRMVARTGRPNGLCLDRSGVVWLAESLEPTLMRLRLDGHAEPVLDAVDGVPLLWPNDLCFGPDGWLYITDSGLRVADLLQPDGGVREDFRTLDYRGTVFAFDPRTGAAATVASGLQFANGIAFGPDEQLYVNESITGNVYRLQVRDGRARGEGLLHANVIDEEGPREGFHGPDGMCFSTDARLWVTVYGQAHVAVLAPDGEVVERLTVGGSGPTNAAFGAPGEKRLYVVETERGCLEAHDVGVDGLPLYR